MAAKRNTRKAAPKRKTASRTTASRSAARKTTTTKAAAGSRPPKLTTADKVRTKSEIFGLLAEHAGISKKEVATVFDTLGSIMEKDLSRRGPGVVNVGGMMKVTVQRKPATKARKGINPFTKEPTVFAAKPARNVVKIRPLKALKELV